MSKKSSKQPALSSLENAVMEVVWEDEPVTADNVRLKLEGTHDLKDSTIRTVLRRLEEKGYVDHDVDGRTYLYRSKVERTNVATSAVRGIVEKFCSGSVENLLVGLVDDNMISPERLKELAEKISQAEAEVKKAPRRTRK